ncbi:MAG TPA: hypothetical protein V6C81_22160 [Planktothrix sp.]|jgi:hypothetical protein
MVFDRGDTGDRFLNTELPAWRTAALQNQEGLAPAVQNAQVGTDSASPYLTNLQITNGGSGEGSLASQAAFAVGQQQEGIGSVYSLNTSDTNGGYTGYGAADGGWESAGSYTGFGASQGGWDNVGGTTAATGSWQSELVSAAQGQGSMQTALNDLGAAYPNDAADAAKAGNQVLQNAGLADMTTVSGAASTGDLSAKSGLDQTQTSINVGPDVTYNPATGQVVDNQTGTPAAPASDTANSGVNFDMGGTDFGVINPGSWDNASPAGTTNGAGWQSELVSAAQGQGGMQQAINDLGAAYPNDAADAAKAGNQVLQNAGLSDMTTVSGAASTGDLSAKSGLDQTQTTTNVGPDVSYDPNTGQAVDNQAPTPNTADNTTPSSTATDPAPEAGAAAGDAAATTSAMTADAAVPTSTLSDSEIDADFAAADFGYGGMGSEDASLLFV